MVICKKGHEPISYKTGKCPLCLALRKNETMRHQVVDLQYSLLISDAEVVMDFGLCEEERVCSAGSRA
ncbi:MAG: hypothetical protein V2B13_20405 [Pseudomonadota bacterium]